LTGLFAMARLLLVYGRLDGAAVAKLRTDSVEPRRGPAYFDATGPHRHPVEDTDESVRHD